MEDDSEVNKRIWVFIAIESLGQNNPTEASPLKTLTFKPRGMRLDF